MSETNPWKPVLLWMLAAVVAIVAASSQERPRLPKPHPDLPDDFRQLLPRGRIASVDQPEFVSAAEAEIPGDAWVLGVVHDGQAKAYSLNLLNRHEVVNDELGGRPIAAVW